MENQSAVTGRVIGCTITVHRILGPKLREATYEEALAREGSRRGNEAVRFCASRFFGSLFAATAGHL
jgi:hypothetical protein